MSKSHYHMKWLDKNIDFQICQNNFGIASYDMAADSLARMKKGLEPLRPEDKEWVSQTPK